MLTMMNVSTAHANIGRQPLPGRNRRIHLVLRGDTNRCIAKFCYDLQAKEPERFLFISGVPNLEDLTRRVTRAHELGWSGDSCIFMIPGSVLVSDYNVLEKAIAREISGWKPRNIWMFTTFLPERSEIDLRFWEIMYLDPLTRNLIEISYSRAQALA